MRIETVLGPISPEALGPTDFHDHLYGAPPEPYAREDPDLVLTDEAAALDELHRFRAAGGTALVECTTVDYRRDAGVLRRLSQASGVHIVAVTGFNKGKFSARLVAGRPAEEWVARFVEDARTGLDGTGARPGAVKAGSSLDAFLPEEEAAFAIAAAVHGATGLPVLTHTEAGTCGPEQLDRLEAAGVDPASVILCHLDRKPDEGYLLGLARRGCFLSFDQVGKAKYRADRKRAEDLARLAAAGFLNRLLLGGDFARRSYWRAGGGALGPSYLLESFVPQLHEVGFTDAEVRQMLVLNPARALAF